VASTALPAIFRAFGTQLAGLPYSNGATASVDSSWTFTSPAPAGSGYTIDSGIAVIIDGQTFYVADTVAVAPGASSAAILLVANQTGSAYNDLGGVNAGYPDVQLNSQIDYVSSITLAAATSGGADQQDDTEYQAGLTSVLALQSPRPITAVDFSAFVASTVALNATGVAVGRSTAIAGYYPSPLTVTASLASGSPTASISAEPFYQIAPYPGASITGTGVPTSATVAFSPTPSPTTFTMSGNATATESGETITIGAFSGVPGAVTVFVTDEDGNPLTSESLTTLQTWLNGYLLEGVTAFVQPASYNQIYVTAQVHPLPGYSTSQAASDAQTAVLTYLSPATWGNPGAASTGATAWLNASQGFDIVRFNRIISVLESPVSVDYAVAGSVSLGFSPSPSGVADLTMLGPACLPQSSASNVQITGI
jgi:hypothetical protein